MSISVTIDLSFFQESDQTVSKQPLDFTMPERSPYNIDIPSGNILSYLFPEGSTPSDKPLWIDSVDPQSKNLSQTQLLHWCKRLGHGLRSRYGLHDGDLVLMLSNNHIYVPVAYLGVTGAGLVFSGCNPTYTARGTILRYPHQPTIALRRMSSINISLCSLSEVARQITDSACKLILVEPDLSALAVEAAQAASLPIENILLFSDAPVPPQRGLLDWQTALPDTEEAQLWRWPTLTSKDAATTVAVLNYSSGYVDPDLPSVMSLIQL